MAEPDDSYPGYNAYITLQRDQARLQKKNPNKFYFGNVSCPNVIDTDDGSVSLYEASEDEYLKMKKEALLSKKKDPTVITIGGNKVTYRLQNLIDKTLSPAILPPRYCVTQKVTNDTVHRHTLQMIVEDLLPDIAKDINKFSLEEWRKEKEVRTKMIMKHLLEKRHGKNYLFKPDPVKGCLNSENWKRNTDIGEPRDADPSFQVSINEYGTNTWQHPYRVIDKRTGKHFCLPEPDWERVYKKQPENTTIKVGRDSPTEPVYYHGLDKLHNLKRGAIPNNMSPGEAYIKNAFCTQFGIGEEGAGECKANELKSTPVGGKMNPSEVCVSKMDEDDNQICVERNAAGVDSGFNTSDYGRWAREQREAELLKYDSQPVYNVRQVSAEPSHARYSRK